MTLTCRLDPASRRQYKAIIEKEAARVLAEPVEFRSLCLFEQSARDRPFIVAERFAFGG
jgi:hypothetical protein